MPLYYNSVLEYLLTNINIFEKIDYFNGGFKCLIKIVLSSWR